MTRLTENKHYIKACETCKRKDEDRCSVISCRHLYATIIKLYDYEETGLTPNEIQDLKAKYYALSSVAS